MGQFPPEDVMAHASNDSRDKRQAFDDKFGKELREEVIDYDLARKEYIDNCPSEDDELRKDGHEDMADTLDILVLDTYISGVNGMLTQDSTIEKIEKLMEDTGQSTEEIGEQLKGSNGKVLEKLDELIEQSQSKSFVDRLDAESKDNNRTR